MKNLILIPAICLLFASCKKNDDVQPVHNHQYHITSVQRVQLWNDTTYNIESTPEQQYFYIQDDTIQKWVFTKTAYHSFTYMVVDQFRLFPYNPYLAIADYTYNGNKLTVKLTDPNSSLNYLVYTCLESSNPNIDTLK